MSLQGFFVLPNCLFIFAKLAEEHIKLLISCQIWLKFRREGRKMLARMHTGYDCVNLISCYEHMRYSRTKSLLLYCISCSNGVLHHLGHE